MISKTGGVVLGIGFSKKDATDVVEATSLAQAAGGLVVAKGALVDCRLAEVIHINPAATVGDRVVGEAARVDRRAAKDVNGATITIDAGAFVADESTEAHLETRSEVIVDGRAPAVLWKTVPPWRTAAARTRRASAGSPKSPRTGSAGILSRCRRASESRVSHIRSRCRRR